MKRFHLFLLSTCLFSLCICETGLFQTDMRDAQILLPVVLVRWRSSPSWFVCRRPQPSIAAKPFFCALRCPFADSSTFISVGRLYARACFSVFSLAFEWEDRYPPEQRTKSWNIVYTSQWQSFRLVVLLAYAYLLEPVTASIKIRDDIRGGMLYLSNAS